MSRPAVDALCGKIQVFSDPVRCMVNRNALLGQRKEQVMAQVDEKELRRFGLMVGTIFIVIAGWPVVWRGEAVRLWAIIPGVLLLVLGVSVPKVLKPVFKGWMTIGHALGWVNTRIILGVVFYGIITPMGVIMRLFGWDSMSRALTPSQDTYRVVRSPRPPSHMKHQF